MNSLSNLSFPVMLKYWKKFRRCDFYNEASIFCFSGQRGYFPEGRPFWAWVKIGQLGGKDGKLLPSQSKLAYTKAEKGLPKIGIPLAFYHCSSNAFPSVIVCEVGSPSPQWPAKSWNAAHLQLCQPFHMWAWASGPALGLPLTLVGPRARVQLDAPSTWPAPSLLPPCFHLALRGTSVHKLHPCSPKTALSHNSDQSESSLGV